MKVFVFILVAISLFSSCNKGKEVDFIVKGIGFENLEGRKIYLWKIKDMIAPEDLDLPIDSATVINGEFEFQGKEDTLHIYYIDESIRFFPERGINIIDPVTPCKNCTPRNQKYWELLQSGLPAEETYQFMIENISNAMGVFMFDQYTGIKPDDMEILYEKTNENMRTSFTLNSLKKQIDSTPYLKLGSQYIDFENVDSKGKILRLSEIAGKGEYVCVAFLSDMNEKKNVEYQINDLKNAYPGLQTIIISNSFNPAPADKEFEEYMQTVPDIYWIPDSIRYEESIHYMYRIRGSINYIILISPEGLIVETKTIRQDIPL